MMREPSSSTKVPEPDFFAVDFKKNPYPTYALWRQNDPVHLSSLPNGQRAWFITRYEDAIAALKEPRFIKNPWTLFDADQEDAEDSTEIGERLIAKHMLSLDPPEHRRLRNLVQKAFTPKMIEKMRPRIEEIANELLDAVQDKGQMELIDDFAFPLPIIVICEMLGVPTADRNRFRKWSNTLVEVANTTERAQQVDAHLAAFTQYLNDFINMRRQQPMDDLVSDLIRAEDNGEHLTQQELCSMVFLLIVAGHETTVNLIANGALALLEHPDQMAKLRADPTLISTAIEEFLRYNGPVEFTTNRWAIERLDFRGKTIEQGDLVLIVLDAADRDETQFEHPDTLDITRKINHHIAFGHGIHYCLGAPLARLEGQIAIRTLLARLPALQLGVDPATLTWRPSMIVRGLHQLPVRF